jgi:hypothetical protein
MAAAGGGLLKPLLHTANVVAIIKNGVFPLACHSVRKQPQTAGVRCSVLQRVEATVIIGRVAFIFYGLRHYIMKSKHINLRRKRQFQSVW